MKLAILAAAVMVAAIPTLASQTADAQIGSKTRVNKCGTYRKICESARMSHVAANYGVSGLYKCHYAPCDVGAKRGEYFYYYWR